MRGKPELLLVFIDLLLNCDDEGIVDVHWKVIMDETGLSEEQVKKAIQELESPDPSSRNPNNEGRRIVRLSPTREWGWQVVNYQHYKEQRTYEERKEYMRNYMRDYRCSNTSDVKDVKQCKTMLNNVKQCKTMLNNVKPVLNNVNNGKRGKPIKIKIKNNIYNNKNIDQNDEHFDLLSCSNDPKNEPVEDQKPPVQRSNDPVDPTSHNLSEPKEPKYAKDFETFWQAYPRKVGKLKAYQSFKKAIKLTTLEKILTALEAQKQSEQWRKENGAFIPHPTTWLNQGRWEDEPIQTPQRKRYIE